MNEKQLPLATFEQAKRLKEAGFDWRVNNYYTSSGMLLDSADAVDFNNSKRDIVNGGWVGGNGVCKSAPTVALSLKWFREVKKIPCAVRAWSNLKYGWEYCYKDNYWHCSMHDNHCNAESALLDELLTLIEKEK